MDVTSKWFAGALCAGLVFAAGCKKEEPAPPPEADDQPELSDPPEVEPEPEPAALEVEPCELVPADRLSELAGVPLQEGKATQNNPSSAICTYDRQKGDVLPGVGIEVSTGEVERLFESKTVIPGGQPVEGVGEKAVWYDTLKQLHVLEGKHVLTVTHPDAKLGREGAQKVAQEVLQKL